MDRGGRTIEACREFMHDRCKRSEDDCKYAHPPEHIKVFNGQVTCCVDSLRDKCHRDKPPCKYFHPPQHLKDRLLMEGRNIRNSELTFRGDGGVGRRSGAGDMFRDEIVGINPYFSSMSGQMDYPGSPSGNRKGSMMDYQDRSMSKSSTIEVCREYLRQRCNRVPEECRFAHPPSNVNVGSDNTVTICMDFVRGCCTRDSCRYFHAPPHLQSRMKSGGSVGSVGRKRSYEGGYNNGDDFGAAKRMATGDFYA